MSERIQKCLARLGYGSRRGIEEWIKEGRLQVNGKTVRLGDHMELTDAVKLDGNELHLQQEVIQTRVLMYHKPAGEICTASDPEGRRSVFEALPRLDVGRWVGVGRLDINTSGLLLFTNDGALANKLMHPSGHMPREYAVRVLGNVTQETLKLLTRGVMLEDGHARFEEIVESGGAGANSWFHVVIMQGRNRIVRRLWESQDLRVSRLQRVRFGPVMLPRSLRPGNSMELDQAQIAALQNESSQKDRKQ
jgi:23S rRNA pseudouridine2605 synthase